MGKKDDCIFCKIIKGEVPSYKIYEDENVYAFLDIAGDVFGHTLVVPKNHYENIFDIPEVELNQVMNAVKKISQHFLTVGYTGVNLMNASGVDAQQSVFHLHFHILPRSKNDGLDTWPKFSKNNFDFEAIAKLLKIN